jgi:hypothetical protein
VEQEVVEEEAMVASRGLEGMVGRVGVTAMMKLVEVGMVEVEEEDMEVVRSEVEGVVIGTREELMITVGEVEEEVMETRKEKRQNRCLIRGRKRGK